MTQTAPKTKPVTNPIRPTNDEARTLAQSLMSEARFAALATLDANGSPLVTRVAFGLCPAGQPISLMSSLAQHSQNLAANPACSLLIGEPGPKGDPLTHPRLSLVGGGQFVDNQSREHQELARHYLGSHPRSKLYIGFADFSFVRFDLRLGNLNGGFGKAFNLTPGDLAQPG